MSVQELEQAVVSLPADDLAAFAKWFEEFRAQAWDEQIANDARAGRFDALIQRAKQQVLDGDTHLLTPGASLAP